jgi:hypothetical protein
MTDSLVEEAIVPRALDPSHFFVASEHALRFEHAVPDRCAWELFRGHLLDRGQTRQERDFTAWHVFLDDADDALLSVKYDAAERRLYVVRSLRVFGQEVFEESGVIDSRPAKKWQRELVGSVDLKLVPNVEWLQRFVELCLFRAVIGPSRLPITSLESPLPQFSLGQLFYLPGDEPVGPGDPLGLLRCLSSDHSTLERAKTLEFVLRAMTLRDIPALVSLFLSCWQAQPTWMDFLEQQRALFNHVALSPYTVFVENWLSFLMALAPHHFPIQDVLSYILRQLVRHLTAFDLTTFHNRGANYPDALFLDAALRCYLELLEAQPPGAISTLDRRALRQACLMRKQLEGLPVPRQPTSPGENLRVLPPPFAPVPEKELLDPQARAKRLFEGQPAEALLTPATRELLLASLADLDEPRELRELGMAVFLDRPFGVFKQPGEVDRTPLLSYEAFSRDIARRRLKELARWGLLSESRLGELTVQLENLPVAGIPAMELTGRPRPGVVALEDAVQAAADFVFLSTTRSSWDRLCDMDPLWRPEVTLLSASLAQCVLLIRTPRTRQSTSSPTPFLTAYDRQMQPRVEYYRVPATDNRYQELAGIEILHAELEEHRYDEQGCEVAPDRRPTWKPYLLRVVLSG